jgi:hypothetical protein
MTGNTIFSKRLRAKLMACRPLTLFLLFTADAVAVPVQLQTDGPLVVEHGGVVIARADGDGEMALGEFPGGPTALHFTRPDEPTIAAMVPLPDDRPSTIQVSSTAIFVDGVKVKEMELASPVVTFRAENDQTFSIVIDGTNRHRLSDILRLDSLTVGPHSVEIRSADNLLIWVRGTLNLAAGDTVGLHVEEGRMVVADGRNPAWSIDGGQP